MKTEKEVRRELRLAIERYIEIRDQMRGDRPEELKELSRQLTEQIGYIDALYYILGTG